MLIVPRGNPENVQSLADLTRPELRVGLAHPTNSALGKLTDQLLAKLNLRDALYSLAAHFDAGKNVQFKTYAYIRVRGAILDRDDGDARLG